MQVYNDAEIYLTRCTHPQFTHLRYIGLDTKCDPNYLGSSVVLKWWISLLGRACFQKEIIDTVSGTMVDCCKVEQAYILRYDAIRDPNFFNMNGGRTMIENGNAVDIDTLLVPTSSSASHYVADLCIEIGNTVPLFSTGKRQFAMRLVCMLVYGYVKYDQESFDYNVHETYGVCQSDEVSEILNSAVSAGIIDLAGGEIFITEKTIDSIPDGINSLGFKVELPRGL